MRYERDDGSGNPIHAMDLFSREHCKGTLWHSKALFIALAVLLSALKCLWRKTLLCECPSLERNWCDSPYLPPPSTCQIGPWHLGPHLSRVCLKGASGGCPAGEGRMETMETRLASPEHTSVWERRTCMMDVDGGLDRSYIGWVWDGANTSGQVMKYEYCSVSYTYLECC